ncbi:MAG: NnrU family protein [Gammaproteobacteria bacterium]|jgi:uncharacterized membrane protein
MATLITGLILFLGTHSISIVAPAWRSRLSARIGTLAWQGIYSVIAIVGLVLIIRGYSAARIDSTVLYSSPDWLRYLSVVLLVPVFPFLLAAYLPGRIQSALQHPMLVATKLWALAHLLANGRAVDIVLFGAFLLWAVADRISLKRRPSPPVPEAPLTRFNDAIAVAAGLAIFAAFILGLHEQLFGVSPVQ